MLEDQKAQRLKQKKKALREEKRQMRLDSLEHAGSKLRNGMNTSGQLGGKGSKGTFLGLKAAFEATMKVT
eukprot:SAG31_NODE_33016_length_349_cov_0.600000_1_plen_69_part_10